MIGSPKHREDFRHLRRVVVHFCCNGILFRRLTVRANHIKKNNDRIIGEKVHETNAFCDILLSPIQRHAQRFETLEYYANK